MVLILKHVSIEGPGIIDDFFDSKGYLTEIREPDKGAKLPKDTDGIQAVVSLGGPMNVYEEEKYPFLGLEHLLIKKLIEKDIPTLGICLGAQLIAKAAGALVRKAKKKEVGWHSVNLTEMGKRDRLFAGFNSKISAFQWHEDCFDVPETGTLLAESKLCHQAFRLGKNIYGLQFHFEVTKDMIKSWSEEYNEKVDCDVKHDFLKNGLTILQNFEQIMTDAYIL